jgi:hypothetical protein
MKTKALAITAVLAASLGQIASAQPDYCVANATGNYPLFDRNAQGAFINTNSVHGTIESNCGHLDVAGQHALCNARLAANRLSPSSELTYPFATIGDGLDAIRAVLYILTIGFLSVWAIRFFYYGWWQHDTGYKMREIQTDPKSTNKPLDYAKELRKRLANRRWCDFWLFLILLLACFINIFLIIGLQSDWGRTTWERFNRPGVLLTAISLLACGLCWAYIWTTQDSVVKDKRFQTVIDPARRMWVLMNLIVIGFLFNDLGSCFAGTNSERFFRVGGTILALASVSEWVFPVLGVLVVPIDPVWGWFGMLSSTFTQGLIVIGSALLVTATAKIDSIPCCFFELNDKWDNGSILPFTLLVFGIIQFFFAFVVWCTHGQRHPPPPASDTMTDKEENESIQLLVSDGGKAVIGTSSMGAQSVGAMY